MTRLRFQLRRGRPVFVLWTSVAAFSFAVTSRRGRPVYAFSHDVASKYSWIPVKGRSMYLVPGS